MKAGCCKVAFRTNASSQTTWARLFGWRPDHPVDLRERQCSRTLYQRSECSSSQNCCHRLFGAVLPDDLADAGSEALTYLLIFRQTSAQVICGTSSCCDALLNGAGAGIVRCASRHLATYITASMSLPISSRTFVTPDTSPNIACHRTISGIGSFSITTISGSLATSHQFWRCFTQLIPWPIELCDSELFRSSGVSPGGSSAAVGPSLGSH